MHDAPVAAVLQFANAHKARLCLGAGAAEEGAYLGLQVA